MFYSAGCLVMAQIQFSLIKKRLDVQNTRYPSAPTPYVRQHLIFALSLPPLPTLKVDVICVSPLSWLSEDPNSNQIC